MKKLLLLLSLLLATNAWGEKINYSEFLSLVENNQVLSVELTIHAASGEVDVIKGKTISGKIFKTEKPPFLRDNLRHLMLEHGVIVTRVTGEEYLEVEGEAVCEVRTKQLEEDILKCKMGDTLSFYLNSAKIYAFGNAIGRACELDTVVSLGTSYAICIYRGSLREVR